MKDTIFFLIDAMALIYRAHFAFIRSPMYSSKGENTSAILGFTNSLIEVINKSKPTHIAVVFDSPEPTHRHLEYSEYKANRLKQPEDITFAIPRVKQLIEAMNILHIELPGYEADDIIGPIAQQTADENNHIKV